jgi:hypothetical protein
VHPGDLDLQRLVPDGPGRRRAGLGGVERGGSELQGFADRLDSPSMPVGVDEPDYLFV